MKEINTSEEVRAKIQALSVELMDLCVANELPFVVATVLSKKQDDEGVHVERIVSAYINGETGATEPTIISAIKLLKGEPENNPIAKLILGALVNAASKDCDCPKCSERRSEAE